MASSAINLFGAFFLSNIAVETSFLSDGYCGYYGG
jgi:hypothetical protein